jgi:predicted DNA-binding transcriptional regulator YafY
MKRALKISSRKAFARISLILKYLSERDNISLKDIKRRLREDLGLSVSDRTIKRDIRTLREDLGFKILYSRKKDGYYFEKKPEFIFPKLTEGEFFTLIITANLINQFKNTPLEKDFESLQKKLEAILTDKVIISSEKLRMALSIPFNFIKPRVDIKDTFEKIFKAINQKNRILIKYHTIYSDEIKERKVDPYHIYNYEGIWYFCGFCHLRNEIRDFALDRVESVRILRERFDMPKDFDFYEYLKSAFRIYKGNTTKVKIKFDSYQAKWIKERIWHETQKIEEFDDGSIIYEIIANEEEIRRWVIGYGSHAEVLEPQSLRDSIKEELKKMIQIYKV